MADIINVILSGGVGSRLWPLSRKLRPKQYLDIFNGQSLFGLTISRNEKFVDRLLILTNANNSNLGKKELESIVKPTEEIIESAARNTAAAIALACFAVHDEDILLVTPSDHIINDDEYYTRAIKEAIFLAEHDNIVTFGIIPTRAETGYGYIEYHNNDVISFREKPNKETAAEFIKSGKFMWNSGMFCFKAKVLLDELAKYDADLFAAAKKAWQNRDTNHYIPEEYMNQIPSKSIDYAVMEKSEKIKMVKSDFFWSDLGAYDSLYDYLITIGHPVDENGNMYIGNKQVYTRFLGIKNSILVNTDDAILVVNKESSQDVRKIYEQLEQNSSKLV
jgi:mannose-1-phosphate guanylyltransferase